MRCPFCNNDDTQVKDSRPSDDGKVIRRRRECQSCSRRFTTFERFQVQQVVVMKRGKQRELFDSEKLMRSIVTALRKRPVPQSTIEKLVNDIEQQFSEGGRSEVTSNELGDAVMAALRELDFVGYIRYASVYNDFKNHEDFEKLLKGE